MGLFDFGTYMNTRDTARVSRRNNSELAGQNKLARAAAKRDAAHYAGTAEVDERELQYRLASDPEFKAWYNAQELAKVQAAAAARLAETQRKSAAQKRREENSSHILWAACLVLAPWAVVGLRYTRARVTGVRYWLLVAWAALIVISAVVQIIMDPSKVQ